MPDPATPIFTFPPFLADSMVQSVGPHLASVGLLVAGIVLWLVGGRLMRAASVVSLAIAGAALAYTAPAELNIDLHPLLTAALGLILGAFAGAILFRFSMAATLAVSLTLAVVTSVALARDLHHRAPDAVRPVDTRTLLSSASALESGDQSVYISRAGSSNAPAASPTRQRGSDDATAAINTAIDRVLDVVTVAADDAKARWETLEPDDQSALRLAALAGAFFGFGLGMMAPLFAASIVTSALGSGLFLASGAALASARDWSFADRLPTTVPAWAVLWLALTVIGTFVQTMPSGSKRKPKREPRCAPKHKPDDAAASPAA